MILLALGTLVGIALAVLLVGAAAQVAVDICGAGWWLWQKIKGITYLTPLKGKSDVSWI